MNFCLLLIIAPLTGCLATVPRPRGVAISMASFYQPGNTFKCLDGTQEFPYEYLNDDYCDCADGSDEPGTSACPGGKFHCTNAGYRPLNIMSSRVNDGICDCCDGTDEYNGNIECVNNCKELGKKFREEEDRARQLQEEGFKQKQRFSEEGRNARAQKQTQLAELEKKKGELEALKSDMEAKKADAEAPEKEAKEQHENAWKESLEQKKAEGEAVAAREAFAELDQDNTGFVDAAELMKYSQFDIDSNGEVSEEEGKEHLESEDRVDLETFTQKVWPNIKELYRKAVGGEETKGEDSTAEPPAPSGDEQDEDEYDDEDEDDDDIEDEDLDHNEDEDDANSTSTDDEEEKMPEYDEATKALIAAADEARNNFNDAERQLKDTENEINSINKYLGLDFGPEEEYSVLQGNCYEYTDREYTYKLCAYDRASQKPKAGGSETSLGNWGRWDGTPEDKYSAQKYENGQNCWNGPNRSVKVQFKCGLEHKLISAFEPSRCEYEFEFETPARCSSTPKNNADPDTHDEL